MRSSIWLWSSSGTLSSTLLTTYAARSSGRTSTSDPFRARPMGERPNATITASVMTRIITPARTRLFQAREAVAGDREGDEGEKAQHHRPQRDARRQVGPPAHGHDHHEQWQPDRARQLPATQRPEALRGQHLLSRQPLLGVERLEDRVHARAVEAA